MFLCFYKTLVSKTAAMLKIVNKRSIYRESNVPVLPNRSQILIFFLKGNGDHSEVRDKFCSNFQKMLIRSFGTENYQKKLKEKNCGPHANFCTIM